jgi:hypothetical protein
MDAYDAYKDTIVVAVTAANESGKAMPYGAVSNTVLARAGRDQGAA